MGQRFQSWRSDDGERNGCRCWSKPWKTTSRPEFRAIPCDPSAMQAAARSNWRDRHRPTDGASNFSLRNRQLTAYSPAICSRGRVAALDPAQFCFLARDIIARHRHHALALGELNLEVHHVLLAERHFRARQIKFPHPRKALVVELHRFLPPRHEAFAPGFQRFGVMQPQDFDVADQKPGALDRRHHFGQRRDIAAGEDVFRDPGIGDVGPSERPIECSIITPSSVSSSAQRRK